MYKRIYLGLAIAACFSVFMFVSSVSCFAQGPGQGQGQGQGQGGPAWMSAGDDMPKAFIEAEDADKDGKVSKDEFGGPDTMFTAMDKDGNGNIELSEAPTSETIQTLMGSMGQPGGGEGGGQGGPQGGTPPQGAPSGAPGDAPSGS